MAMRDKDGGNKDDGGMAFPGFVYTSGYGQSKINSRGDWEEYSLGFSKRDYFAAQSIAGRATAKMNVKDMENMAARAYELADAMLRERAK
jgi:hypothetical protein